MRSKVIGQQKLAGGSGGGCFCALTTTDDDDDDDDDDDRVCVCENDVIASSRTPIASALAVSPDNVDVCDVIGSLGKKNGIGGCGGWLSIY